MTLSRCLRAGRTVLLSALLLLIPVALHCARAQSARAAPTAAAPGSAAPVPADAPQKSLTERAIDKAKQAARSASDIFSRVPCLPPKGDTSSIGSLPHVAKKLANGEPVVIIAFGSSSTQGWGSTAPEFTYPN